MNAAFALLLYPGLLLTLGLALLHTTLTSGRLRLRLSVAGAAWRSAEGLLNATSMVLAGLSLTLLPWPLHPIAPETGVWVWAWAVLEAAFLLPLLSGLLIGAPLVARAASREAQMGVAGRALLWLALGVGLLLYDNWSPVALPAHVLAALAAILAFPAAIGWGPFAAETSITPGGTEHGLDSATTTLAYAARVVRTTALLAASLVALLPWEVLPAWVGLPLLLAVFAAVSVVLRRLTGKLPRLPLPDALRLCWWRALPLGVAAVIYLAVIDRL